MITALPGRADFTAYPHRRASQLWNVLKGDEFIIWGRAALFVLIF